MTRINRCTLFSRFPHPRRSALLLLVALVAAGCSDAPTNPVLESSEKSAPAEARAGSAAQSVLVGANLFVDGNSRARRQADAWRTTRPGDAAQMDKIAAQPQARWFGDWNKDVRTEVAAAAEAATRLGQVPVYVVYNIPQRDCGGLSGGGGSSAAGYTAWIRAFADGLTGRKAVVVVEPDALAAMDCLSPADQQTRVELIQAAVRTLKGNKEVAVYLDAGHPRWKSTATMADRLARAGLDRADGFALNVSNFFADAENVAYGEQLSSRVGGKHFVIDSSRNGLGPTADAQWCNPVGRALGQRPTTRTGHALVDGFLWIKTPGDSDGACNGAPAAGVWWPEYALGLAERAAY